MSRTRSARMLWRNDGLARRQMSIRIARVAGPLTARRRLRKVRYRIPAGDGLDYELDVYGGWLSGLMTAEIEFPSLGASAAFQPPSWLGQEVTSDPSYKNQALAQREAQARADRVFRLRVDEPVRDGIVRIASGQI